MSPRIDHIIGEGSQLAESQRKILEVMQKNTDYLWRMAEEDLYELQSAIYNPEKAPAGGGLVPNSAIQLGTIRWAISTLHNRGFISKVSLNRRMYYGSHEAVKNATEQEKSRSTRQ